MYGAIELNSSPGQPRLEYHDWPLDVTGQVDEDLHHALCNHIFEGIVVCKDYVLVTHTKDGTTERIGLISTHTEEHPRLCFPGSRRDIILG